MADILYAESFANIRTRRQQYEIIRAQLENEVSSHTPHWRDLADFHLPRRPRWFVSDVNKGDRRSQKIVDTTATLSVRTFRSGMHTGVTSPARPWFLLTLADLELAELDAPKAWLHTVAQRMRAVFVRSNLYAVLPVLYGDLGLFGVSAVFVEEDFDRVMRFYLLPIGSYRISTNEVGVVDTFTREFQMTVRQLVDKFAREGPRDEDIDWSKLSNHVRFLWQTGHKETWVQVVHVILPNDRYEPGSPDPSKKKYASVYYERGTSGYQSANYISEKDDERFLRDSGYDYFPVLAPRWEVNGEDVYSTDCPGMTALGDVKQLQTMEKRALMSAEKSVNPPVQIPIALKNQKVSLLPGDSTAVPDTTAGVTPIHEVQARLESFKAHQDEVRLRIKRAWFEDLFLMLQSFDQFGGRQITAREVEERHEEKLLALGPVLEQLNQDLLDPLIDIAFLIMERQGLIPEPPEEIQGLPLRVEYVSIMAQAAKLAGVSSMERLLARLMEAVQLIPQITDKIDLDEFIEEYADKLGIPPEIIRSDEAVAALRQARAQAEQQAAAMQQAAEGAKAAKALSETDMARDSMLKRLADQAAAGQLVQGKV